MTTTLIDMHTHLMSGTLPQDCACPRAACGAAVSGPHLPPSGCTAHSGLTVSHPAYDCPALPADTDLSRLWLIVIRWTADGPVPQYATAFDRATLAELRGTNALWAAAEGGTGDNAIRAWQARVDAMRTRAAAEQAAQIAAAQERARHRMAAEAALRRSARSAARRLAAVPLDADL